MVSLLGSLDSGLLTLRLLLARQVSNVNLTSNWMLKPHNIQTYLAQSVSEYKLIYIISHNAWNIAGTVASAKALKQLRILLLASSYSESQTAFALIKTSTLVCSVFRRMKMWHSRCGWTGRFIWVRSVQAWLPITSISNRTRKWKMAHILRRNMPLRLLMSRYWMPVRFSLPSSYWKTFRSILGEKDCWSNGPSWIWLC